MAEKRTVKQLQAEIRRTTNEINARIIGYRDSLDGNPPNQAFEKAVARLKKAGTSRKTLEAGKVSTGAKGEIGLGLKGKRKAELEEQLRGLEAFQRFDIYSPEALKEAEQRANKAYKTFQENYGFIGREDYEALVNIFASSKESLGLFYKALGGQGILDIYTEASQKDKVNLARHMEDIIKEMKGVEGLTATDYANLLRQRIGMV